MYGLVPKAVGLVRSMPVRHIFPLESDVYSASDCFYHRQATQHMVRAFLENVI